MGNFSGHTPVGTEKEFGHIGSTIVYSLVTDLITHSHIADDQSSFIGFGEEVAATLQELKTFNYERGAVNKGAKPAGQGLLPPSF